MSLPTLREAGIQTIIAEEAQPGDAVFCHSAHIIGKSIRLGQYLKRFAPAYRKWNHIAWLNEPIYGDDGFSIVDWYVGQAIASGVSITFKLSDIAPGGEYEIVPLVAFPATVNGIVASRAILLATLRSQVGVKYGFLTIASEIFTILTPKFVRIDFRRDNTWICSGLYSYALLSGGGKIVGDVYQIMPAGVAESVVLVNAT